MIGSLLLVTAAAIPLQPGQLVQHAVAGGQPGVFSIAVSSDAFVQGVVDQGDVDLIVDVFDPSGTRLTRIDHRDRGEEVVAFHAAGAGTYRLEVHTVSQTARRSVCRVRLDPLRPPQAEDAGLTQPASLSTEAKRLLAIGDRASAQAALSLLVQAHPLWRAAGRSDVAMSTLVATGDAHYALNEYDEANRVYRQALDLSREAGDARTEGEVLNNLAMIAWPQGDVTGALALMQQALDRWRALKFTFGEATALSNRGILLRQTGEYDLARQHYAKALALFRSLNDRRGEAYALNNIGIVLESLGERREALGQLRRAIRLFQLVKDDRAAARARLAESRIELGRGNDAAAAIAVREALPLIQAAGDRLAEADAMVQRGRIRDIAGERLAARGDFDAARTIYHAIGSRRGESDALHYAGVSHLQSANPRAALPLLREALDLRRAIGMPGLEAESLFRVAQAERAVDDWAAARATLEAAIERSEQLRAGVFERELRSTSSGSTKQYYDEYVDLLIALHRRQPEAAFDRTAFEAVERSRARGLTELLQESRALGKEGGARELFEQARELRASISYWSWQLWQQSNRPTPAGSDDPISSRLDGLLLRYRELDAEIRRRDPRYATFQSPRPVSLDAVQTQLLDARTTLLEYALGERRSFLWIVTRDSVSVVDLPGRAAIETPARRLAAALAINPRDLSPDARVQRDRDAARLSRLILGPAARALRNRLVIVPDGALREVPFGVLPAPAPATDVLAATVDLVTLPSTTTLALLDRELAERPPAPKLLAVLANPVFDVSNPRVPATSRRPDPAARGLARLPFSREEAERLLALVPEAQRLRLVGFDANRERMTNSNLYHYRFVHFATHAIRNDRHPSLSGIVLSLVGPNGEPRDGFLRLQDIFSLRLQADLAVLSACETGVGDRAQGEGLSGLAQGFFYSGAARVLASLWKVDDEATAELMAIFYRELLRQPDVSPASALRAAQRELRRQERWSDAFFWSGFVLSGRW